MIAYLLRNLTRLESLLWILAFGLSIIVIGGVGTLVRGLNYELLTIVSLGGLLLGWLLARIRAPWWLALIMIIGSGLEMVIVLVGHLLPLFLNLLGVLLSYPIILWWWGIDALPGLEPLWLAWQELSQGSGVVLTRLGTWLLSLGEVGTHDPLPLQLVWGWALWVATAWAAYQIWLLRQALLAVVPLGILLTLTIFFSGINYGTLSVFLFLALALQVTNSWKRRQHRWEMNQIDWATDISHDVAFVAGVLISLIVILSAVIPQISISRIIDNLSLHFQERLAHSGHQVDSMAASFGIERRAPLPTRPRPVGIPGGLPRRHLLGSGPELTEQLVMLIKTNDPLPVLPYEPEYGGRPPPAHYWLAATYDIYNGRGWRSSPTKSVALNADETQLEPVGPGRVVSQTVRLVDPFGNLLFTSGFPVQVDRPSEITFRSNQDWAGTTLETDETYVAQSWLPQPSAEELTAAGTDYPDWVAKRYLTLPDNLPSRVRTLALELTATAATPYDRALAIEAYLRTIPYSLDVPTPPTRRDVVDYFLFDLQQGYCDYYATSMVVLARAAGLPARFVIGYAPSPYDYDSYQYVVREAEAHSWAQIYFPDYGWIDFEPTGGRAPISRLGEEDERSPLPPLPADFDLNKALAAQQTWWETMPLWQVLVIGLTGLAGVFMLGMLIVGVSNLRLARLPVDQLIPVLQSRLERSAELLGVSWPEGTTPLEFQTALVGHLEHLAQRYPGLERINPASADIAKLVNAFVLLRYAPHPATTEIGRACLNAWYHLRWRLWGTIMVKKVRRIR